MKLEREPVFGHFPINHKADSKPFDHNGVTLDSAGLQSANRIMKESQNRVLCDSKGNEEDAGQAPYMKNDGHDLAASRFDSSKSVDDLENCDEDEVKDFVSPYTLSPEKLEALERESDFYTDKSVMECELPELSVCDKDGNCNTIKDICIDEGVPSQDKMWYETGVDEKAYRSFKSRDEDQNRELLDEQMDVVMTIPDGFKSSAQYDLDKDFSIPCDSKGPMQIGDTKYGASEKTAIDVSKDMFSPENGLSTQDLGAGNVHSKPSNEDMGEAVEETVQISSEKGSESPALVSATEESNDTEKEELVSTAEESNFLVDELSENSKVENISITFGLDNSPAATIPRDDPPNVVREHFETQKVPVDDDNDGHDDMSDSEIVPGQVHDCIAPMITGTDECPENGVCQSPETSNTPQVDDHICDSIPSHIQHWLAPVAIAKEERPETSNTSVVEDVNSDIQNAPLHFQRGLGESSFSAVTHFSSLLNSSGPYSGNVSLRSESSTTSTRSFAFPVLQSEWNSSPVRMAKADRRHLGKHKGWRHSLLCCRF